MRFKRENKGFSLVELIVVIAIFSVVGVVVGGFLLTASRSYAVNANELNLQEEAQLVSNQVQEMILDTAYGISYQYVVTDATGAQLINYMENDAATLPAGDLSQKDLYIYGKDQYYHIFWDKEECELYLKEYEKNASGNYVLVTGMPNEGVLFGEYVADFKVDLSKIASDRMVGYSIKFKKPGSDRDYLVTRTVSIRNNILMNKPIEEVYDAAGVEFQPAADDFDISPTAPVTLWPGESQLYQPILTCSRGGVPNQDVTYSISSADATPLSLDTKMSSGNMLNIGMDESNKKILLYVQAKGYDYSSNTEKTLYPNNNPLPLEVNIRRITDLEIVENGFDSATSIGKGGTYMVQVEMNGENLSGTVADAGGISVIFTQGGQYASIENIVYEDLKATYYIKINDQAPIDSEIGLSFRPAKEGFTGIHVETPVYKVGSSTEEILRLANNGSSLEWLRLGTVNSSVTIPNATNKQAYCDNNKLKSGYSIEYTYRVLNSNGEVVQTSVSTKGANTSQSLMTYFSGIQHSSAFSAAATLSDKVFLQSGMVLVSAKLISNTSGNPVTVGVSNVVTYHIPEATIAFKRANSDKATSNLTSYITSKQNKAQIYVSFPTGFASTGYKIAYDGFAVNGTEHGDKSSELSDLSKNKIAVVGKNDVEYKLSKGNTIEVTYGGLPQKVKVILTTANVSGTDYYVPLNTNEWTFIGISDNGSQVRKIYQYYVDDSHRMHIECVVDEKNIEQFDKAVFYSLENMEWKQVNYTMNKLNKTWELALP